MILWALVIAAAVPNTTDVLVFSKHHPQEVRFEGDCRDNRAKPVGRLVRDGHRVAGAGPTARPEVAINCRKAATLYVGDVSRRFGRRFHASVKDKELRIVATVDFESYVAGVIAAELPRAPSAAQEAQAIVARTYALHAIRKPRHEEAPLCDLTHCQVYAGPKGRSGAAAQTRGRYLVAQGGKGAAEVYFHSTCGGSTLDAKDVWPGASAAVVGIKDADQQGSPFCGASPHFYWVSEIPATDAAGVLSKLAGRPLDPKTAVFRVDPKHRATVGDRHGQTSVTSMALQREFGKRLGWNTIKSTQFEVTRASSAFRVRGQGLGHRVGLCQHGAMTRASRGQSAAQILRAYFPRLEVVK